MPSDEQRPIHRAGSPKERKHRWLTLGLGRICENCQLLQERPDYDDAPTCSGFRFDEIVVRWPFP